MSGPSTYKPNSGFERWLDARLPLPRLMHDTIHTFPTPRNLNIWYTFGGILTFCLGVQIVTGVVLAMHYVANAGLAFDSVESIMRDVNYGWLMRYMHSNGASMFFLAVYIHMFRGLYYGSYKAPRELIWIIGVLDLCPDDGHRLLRLCAALGPDVLLGRHGHHQPVHRHSGGGQPHRHLAVGRLRGR